MCWWSVGSVIGLFPPKHPPWAISNTPGLIAVCRPWLPDLHLPPRLCLLDASTLMTHKQLKCHLSQTGLISFTQMFLQMLRSQTQETSSFTLLKNFIKHLFKCGDQWFFIFLQSCATIVTVLFQDIFINYQKKLHPRYQSFPISPFSEPLAATSLLSVTMDLFIWTFLINGILHYMVFCNWLLSLGMVLSWFIHVVEWIGTSFLFVDK